MTSQEQVTGFILQVKEAITSPVGHWRTWDIVLRQENIDGMAELGFTLDDVRDEILDLDVSDYSEGPVPDRDVKGDLWIFGRIIQEKEVYIKLKLAQLQSLKLVKVISFHQANKPLHYPFKI